MAWIVTAVGALSLRVRDIIGGLLLFENVRWALRWADGDVPSCHWWRPSREGAADEQPAARHEPCARASKMERRGDRAAHWADRGRERALADAAAGEQRPGKDERRGEEQQARVEPADVQADEPQRGEAGDAGSRAHRVVRPPAHRTVAFTVVVYSSKSDTRSVTASFQSPPGLSVTESAT